MNSDQTLPGIIPLFPLRGALLLPDGRMPLRVFEPRYLSMVNDIMAPDHGRAKGMVGLIQPREPKSHEQDRSGPPALFDYGCLGEIVNIEEGAGGSQEIVVSGISRFRILKELEVPTPYRQALADYGEFRNDVGAPSTIPQNMRNALLQDVSTYLETRGLSLDQSALVSLGDEELVTALCMMAPFEPAEKQALLECRDLSEMVETLMALISFAIAESPDNFQPVQH